MLPETTGREVRVMKNYSANRKNTENLSEKVRMNHKTKGNVLRLLNSDILANGHIQNESKDVYIIAGKKIVCKQL